ncbi:hypothetical protein ACWGDE_16770 [Streptomyces sp. NPDC054956]
MSHNTGWGPHPGQHPGQPGPQWGGGWMPPSAPKPGVIPLQPLGAGEILSGSFAAFRRHWKALAGVIFAVQGVGLLLTVATFVITVLTVTNRFSAVFDLAPGEEPVGADVAALFLALLPATVLLLITMAVGLAVICSLCPAVVQEAVLGRTVTFGALWRRTWSRLPSVLGTLLLTGLIAGGPILVLYAVCVPLIIMSADGSGPPAALIVMLLGVLVLMPLTVWLMTRFSLATVAAVFEELRPVAALRRSSQLVRDNWWRVFGIALLGQVVAAAVGYVIQLPFGFIGFAALLPTIGMSENGSADPGSIVFGFVVYAIAVLVGGMISGLFQYTFPQLVVSLLYVDQRMRKENLAASLIASLPPVHPAGPTPPPGPASDRI